VFDYAVLFRILKQIAASAKLFQASMILGFLYPIELALSKLKKLVRDGAERTVDALWNLCGSTLDKFTNEECRNYFKHCGYRNGGGVGLRGPVHLIGCRPRTLK